MSDIKPKRRLSNMDFSQEGAHLALVHKDQGGAASGYSTLIMKATAEATPEMIEKMQQVKVTMELDDFLEKFFRLWDDEAAVLAAMMGYKEEAEGEGEPSGVYQDDSFWSFMKDKYGDKAWEQEPTTADHQEWIATRLEGIEIIKSFKDVADVTDVFTNLKPIEKLAILKDQERIEKAFSFKDVAIKQYQEQINKASGKLTAVQDNEIVVKAEQSKKARIAKRVNKQQEAKAVTADVKIDKGEKPMTQKKITDTTVVEQTVQLEMVEKAQYDALSTQVEEIRKAFEEQQEVIKAYKQREAEAIAKARKLDLTDAVQGVEEHAELLFKAVGELEQEKFDSVLTVLKALSTNTAADPMFQEVGSTEVVTKSLDTDPNAALIAMIRASRSTTA